MTMTAARRRCPCRAEWPQNGWGLAAAPSSSSSPWLGAAGCLHQVLGVQGQSGREGDAVLHPGTGPLRAGHGGKGQWGRRRECQLRGASRCLRCWQTGVGGGAHPARVGWVLGSQRCSARALPGAEWRQGAIRQLCSVRFQLRGAAASGWSWSACTRAGGLQAPGGTQGVHAGDRSIARGVGTMCMAGVGRGTACLPFRKGDHVPLMNS